MKHATRPLVVHEPTAPSAGKYRNIVPNKERAMPRFPSRTRNVAHHLLLSLPITFAVACTSPSQPETTPFSEGARYLVAGTFAPEVEDRRTGLITTPGEVLFRGTAVVRNGVLRLETSPSGFSQTSADTTYTLSGPDVEDALDALGFTAGANPEFAAPIDPSDLDDTVSVVNDSTGVLQTVTQHKGSYGQPLVTRYYYDGVQIGNVKHIWTPVGSGYKLWKVTYEDLLQPDIIIRYRFTVTDLNVVELTHLEKIRGALSRSPHRLASVTRRGARALADLCLPTPAYAALPAGTPCQAATSDFVWKTAAAVIGGALWAGQVATGSYASAFLSAMGAAAAIGRAFRAAKTMLTVCTT